MDNAQTTARSATVSRDTLETQITVSVCLDGTGKAEFDTGLPFLEHMLDQIARHGMVDLNIKANGDLHIDAHHTVEDIGKEEFSISQKVNYFHIFMKKLIL